MKIFTIPAGVLRANSYIVTEDGKSAVLIDCGGKEPLAFAEQKGIKIEYVLLTHGHFDHIGGCAALQAAGAKIGCLAGEEKLVGSPADLSAAMGIPVEPFRLDFTFRDGEVLDLCGMRFSVIATPGHTKGGCCFLCGLRQSVQALLALEGDKTVYPGHDEPTTLSHERKFNPFA